MRRFPKLRPGLWDGVTAGIILLLACVCAFWRSGQATAASNTDSTKTNRLTAVVYIDVAEADRIALDRVNTADRTDTADQARISDQTDISEIRTYSHNGYTVHVQFYFGDQAGAQVIEADCPSQDCVYMGRISRIGQMIICLPSRIIICLEGGADPAAPDAVLG